MLSISRTTSCRKPSLSKRPTVTGKSSSFDRLHEKPNDRELSQCSAKFCMPTSALNRTQRFHVHPNMTVLRCFPGKGGVMAGRGYAIFDTGVGRCGIVWSDAGVVGVQLPETRE